MTVIDLHDRLRRALKLRAPIEVREYQRAAIDPDVCVATHGLTLSNDRELGLVIHNLPKGAA